MNRYTLIFTFLSFLVLISGFLFKSETVDYGELIERNNIYYKKFLNVPFTGKTSGKEQGYLKKGLREGEWVSYHENGQLQWIGTYKNGKKESEWVEYHDDGKLRSKGHWKNGKEEGNQNAKD